MRAGDDRSGDGAAEAGGTALVMRLPLPGPLLAELDRWRRTQPGLPTRAEAARRLLEVGLARTAPAGAWPWLRPGSRDGADPGAATPRQEPAPGHVRRPDDAA